jgi:RNA polymerase sigma-70 factor, ECF subfamily
MEAIDHLLDCARQGESEALSQLYRRFLPGIFAYIAARVPERTIAEDLTSEVFLAMIENIYRLKAQDQAGFVAWLLQIARMKVAGYYRKQENRPVVVPLDLTCEENDQKMPLLILDNKSESDPVRQAEVRDDWNRTVQAINALTENQRLVLVGRLILGYDIATVASIVGKKANAIKALQFRALQNLQYLLQKQDIPENSHQPYKEKTP